jgi:hypothetical protein
MIYRPSKGRVRKVAAGDPAGLGRRIFIKNETGIVFLKITAYLCTVNRVITWLPGSIFSIIIFISSKRRTEVTCPNKRIAKGLR